VEGGLGLTNQDAGSIIGAWGAAAFFIASIVGGLVLGKIVLSRKTLMMFAATLVVPNLAFLWLARTMPAPGDYWLITAVICIGQLGYGFGAVAHMYYMMRQIAPGEYQTAFYAFASGAMGLCNFSAGFVSGHIVKTIGFQSHYTLALACVGAGILAAWSAPFVHSMKHEPEPAPTGAGPAGA
jgi:PAT family beta-lactamase induction signal transducer AmpG